VRGRANLVVRRNTAGIKGKGKWKKMGNAISREMRSLSKTGNEKATVLTRRGSPRKTSFRRPIKKVVRTPQESGRVEPGSGGA